MFVSSSGRYEHSLQKTFYRSFLPSFSSLSQTVSEENNLKYQPCLLMDRDEIHRCFLPNFGSFGQAVLEENNIRKELPVAAMFVNGSERS